MQQDDVRWLEAELPGARVAFSTRLGGVSAAPWDTLNLGLLTGDDPAAVLHNRQLLARDLGLAPERVAIARQVHGTELLEHRSAQEGAPFATRRPPPEGDGHHTEEPELGLLVFVADCLPIAVAGERGVVMLHGGWRGLAGGIVEGGVRAVGGVAAAVGPGIGPCCFEVGPEVIEAFAPLGRGVAAGGMLDLREVVRRQLADAGVGEVEVSELCTRCHPELFFSHRGEGPRTGRQAGVIWREAPCPA
jgi:YfiH family protein